MEVTTDRLDARPRQGLLSDVMHNMNNGHRESIHLPPLPHSDSKRSAGRGRIAVDTIKYPDRSNTRFVISRSISH